MSSFSQENILIPGPAVLRPGRLTAGEIERLTSELASKTVQARRIDGARLGSKADLLKAIALAFSFPGYFGNNWDALVDCWSDMSWLPAAGYVCFFTGADAFRKKDPAAHDMLLKVAGDVAQRWKDPPEKLFKLVRVAGAV